MPPHAKTAQRKQSHSPASAVGRTERQPALQIVDQRPEAVVQRRLIEVANSGLPVAQLQDGPEKEKPGGKISEVGKRIMARNERGRSLANQIGEIGRTSLAVKKGDTVPTKLGATIARRHDKIDQIADPTAFMTEQEISTHLGQYAGGAHAFITPYAHGNIDGAWGGWGKDNDTNFVSPLIESEKIYKHAVNNEGIFSIERSLGIESGKDYSWAHPKYNPQNKLWRYIVPDPVSVGLRMVNGTEGQAYKNEWIAGGKTLGGANEAGIDVFRGDLFKQAIEDRTIIRKEVQLRSTEKHMATYFPDMGKTKKKK